MNTDKKSSRVTIICSGDRRTAFIKVGDWSLESVGSKEELLEQWSKLRCNGRLSDGQSRWLLPVILTCKLRAMTKRAAADNRVFQKGKERASRRHVPLNTLGGNGLSRHAGSGGVVNNVRQHR